jgi:hypothetical protein
MKIANTELNVNFSPTQDEMEQIEQWLIQESKLTDNGFYCNWNEIFSDFHNGRIAILNYNNCAIGFVTWSISQFKARIEIAEIKPNLRNKRFGKYLLDALLENLIQQTILVVDLHCKPITSKPFWKSLGFIELPLTNKSTSLTNFFKNKLYKVLTPATPIFNSESNGDIIELWCSEPHKKGGAEFTSWKWQPKIKNDIIELWCSEPHKKGAEFTSWKWQPKIKNDKSEFEHPIVFPAHPDWRIQWRKGNIIKKDSKIKYFDKEQIDVEYFIAIRKLPS